MSITPHASQADAIYWVALSTFLPFGPRHFQRLAQAYDNDMARAWRATAPELQRAGITPKTAAGFTAHRARLQPEAEMAKLAREHIGVVTLADEHYPALLKETADAPPVLYYRGELAANTALCLAVVGSRKSSAYGRRVTERLVGDCAAAGVGIVSGLALGIDALAHDAALANRGRTAAVLGSGINRAAVYPATNRPLAERLVAAGGLLLSEFPYGAPPLAHHFPRRNRIIAGLAVGTLVIEASAKSGALITARYALEQNRDVFAVPGDIFRPTAAGTNALIQSGAVPVTAAQDILDGLGVKNVRATVAARTSLPQTEDERRLAALLTSEPTHANRLARELKLDTPAVNATLLTMELKGIVRNLGGGNYVLS